MDGVQGTNRHNLEMDRVQGTSSRETQCFKALVLKELYEKCKPYNAANVVTVTHRINAYLCFLKFNTK